MISFNECINEVIDNEFVRELNIYSQHLNSSRFEHSFNVALITYKLCTYFKLDDYRIKEATVAALLHDLFLYDWRTEGFSSFKHTFAHAKNACINAKMITNLSTKQENIILSHMFPLCVELPNSLEAWIVQYADKVSALKEYLSQGKTYSLSFKPIIYLINISLFLHI